MRNKQSLQQINLGLDKVLQNFLRGKRSREVEGVFRGIRYKANNKKAGEKHRQPTQ